MTELEDLQRRLIQMVHASAANTLPAWVILDAERAQLHLFFHALSRLEANRIPFEDLLERCDPLVARNPAVAYRIWKMKAAPQK